MTHYHCTQCQAPFPEEVVYKCPICGGVFGVAEGIDYDEEKVDNTLPGLWRYKDSFGLPPDAPVVSLGEGDTPLVMAEVFGQQIRFKLEYLNPTSSFKDRITAPEISYLASKGVTFAVEDSSGNAGSSFAAYAARAKMKGRVYIPAYASGPKRAQIEAYGQEVVAVPGPRSAATDAVLQAIEEEGAVYASHAYLPFGHVGLATIAYELLDQIGDVPGTVIAPAGQGSLLYGVGIGFQALEKAGKIDRLPDLVGVQAAACAPFKKAFEEGLDFLDGFEEGETMAEGVRIRHPLFLEPFMELANTMSVEFVSVTEDQIKQGHTELAHLGFFVEPTSAVVWGALQQVADKKPGPIVVILTGSGLKSVK